MSHRFISEVKTLSLAFIKCRYYEQYFLDLKNEHLYRHASSLQMIIIMEFLIVMLYLALPVLWAPSTLLWALRSLM